MRREGSESEGEGEGEVKVLLKRGSSCPGRSNSVISTLRFGSRVKAEWRILL